MDLILISYPDFFEEETAIVSSLLEQFDFTFHLRKPDASSNEYIQFLEAIPYRFYNRIVIHNQLEIYKHFNLRGIHFSTSNRGSSQRLSQSIRKSTSCHSLPEIKDLDGKFDYAFLSPVFPSISKKGYKGNLNLNELKNYLEKDRKTKVYALGGIEANKLEKLKPIEFDGIAILGTIWTDDPQNNQEIEKNFEEIYQQFIELYQ